jgi:hypothetical protein
MASKFPPKGDSFELRVQRALFWEGIFTRRRVDLKEYFAPEEVQITDADLLGIGTGVLLRPERLVAECKERKGGGREADRALWILGVGRFLHASHIVFAKPRIAGRLQEWAEGQGLICWDEPAIGAIETRHGLDDSLWFGSHRPELMLGDVANWINAIRAEPELHRAFSMLRGDYWYDDNVRRTKRLAYVFSLYGQHRDRLAREVAQYILIEGMIALIASVLVTTNKYLETSPARFGARLQNQFSGGMAPVEKMRELAGRMDDYYQKKLRDLAEETARFQQTKLMPVNVPRVAGTIAQAPEWLNAYAGLVERVARSSETAQRLLQFADLLAYEVILAGNKFPTRWWGDMGGDPDRLLKQLQNVAYFMWREWSVREEDIRIILDLKAGDLLADNAQAHEPVTTSPKQLTLASPNS